MIIHLAWIIFIVCFGILGVTAFSVFFDQAVLVRRDTIFRGPSDKKQVALTFDDGPSEIWTVKILDTLKASGIKASFFMIGAHVKQFPEIARRVAREGHTVANHGYAHSVVFYYTPEELEQEIKYTELVIKEITGKITKFYRPPKAWIRGRNKTQLKAMGYETILWSVNSKDWAGFNQRSIVRHISRTVQNGDIILFHDSGGVFKAQGGGREQTVQAVSMLAKVLKEKGFEFVTLEDML